jgi:hypothetical protein
LSPVASAASLASRESRRAGGPALTPSSSRESLIEWLAWNDPNGSYRDEDALVEDRDPLTSEEAWELVAAAIDG